MDELNQNTWYTGDWKSDNNNQVPYNGLKIVATANYSLPASPPSSRKLVSVDLDVVDYTYNTNGVSSSLSLYKAGIWTPIPIPALPPNPALSPPEVSQSQPNPEFTVVGTGNYSLGRVQLNTVLGGTFLNIQFRYGPEYRKREEIGYIMKFDEPYVEGQNPIQVE